MTQRKDDSEPGWALGVWGTRAPPSFANARRPAQRAVCPERLTKATSAARLPPLFTEPASLAAPERSVSPGFLPAGRRAAPRGAAGSRFLASSPPRGPWQSQGAQVGQLLPSLHRGPLRPNRSLHFVMQATRRSPGQEGQRTPVHKDKARFSQMGAGPRAPEAVTFRDPRPRPTRSQPALTSQPPMAAYFLLELEITAPGDRRRVDWLVLWKFGGIVSLLAGAGQHLPQPLAANPHHPLQVPLTSQTRSPA